MRVGELAVKLAISRIHAWRLARSGVVPGCYRTKGGQYRFRDSVKLRRWINKATYKTAFYRAEMRRAYKERYGDKKLDRQLTNRRLMVLFRKSERMGKHNRPMHSSDYHFICSFLDSLDELPTMLKIWMDDDFTGMRKEVSKITQKRILRLKSAVDKWLEVYRESSSE